MNNQVMDQSLSHRQDFPPLTDELLAEVVRRIRSVGEPVKIVLFGSRARGDYEQDSDIDILIIEEAPEGDFGEKRRRYDHVLRDVYPERTVIVESLQTVEEWRYVPAYLATVAQKEGRVLFEDSERIADWLNASISGLVREGTEHKTPADLALSWFKQANVDIEACRLTIEGELYNRACFLAEQAAEKYLKGFLAFHGAAPDKSHDLQKLAACCDRVTSMKGLQVPQLAKLAKYAVLGRYGLDFYPPYDAADEALTLALRIKEIILAHVPETARP